MTGFSAAELLSRHNIEYRQTRSGKYSTACPDCNGEGYLDVKIDGKGVQWHCQSCKQGNGEYFEQYDERTKPTVDFKNPKAVYDYVDESGRLLFQTMRLETDTGLKKFCQRTGPDQEKWSIKGVRIVPYRLPELVEDVSRGSAIFVVEGEKDVDNLRRRGIPATCNPMGAKKWWPDFNKILGGADVVICGDNDEPGREHVALVARNLRPVVKRLRVLDLASVWSEIEESQDISDWFAAGLEVERLLALADGLPDWTPAKANGHDDAPGAETSRTGGAVISLVARRSRKKPSPGAARAMAERRDLRRSRPPSRGSRQRDAGAPRSARTRRCPDVRRNDARADPQQTTAARGRRDANDGRSPPEAYSGYRR